MREQSGLALSSRNAYLDDEQHKAATILYRALAQAREVYLEGERNPTKLAETVRAQLDSEPLARIEYVGVVDAETMEKFERIPEDRAVLIALAAHVGGTRLTEIKIQISNLKFQIFKSSVSLCLCGCFKTGFQARGGFGLADSGL